MPYFNDILEFLNQKEFTIPLSQVALLIAINSFCLLLGKHKLGLLVSYAFVFYWGFIFNRVFFVSALGETTLGLYIYAIMGLSMIIVTLIGFIQSSD